jgi:hypothetical protein
MEKSPSIFRASGPRLAPANDVCARNFWFMLNIFNYNIRYWS